eukprot:4185725-Amphidinium_carterae.1
MECRQGRCRFVVTRAASCFLFADRCWIALQLDFSACLSLHDVIHVLSPWRGSTLPSSSLTTSNKVRSFTLDAQGLWHYMGWLQSRRHVNSDSSVKGPGCFVSVVCPGPCL